MNLYSEFTKYCRFWFKIFQNVMWKNSIFLTSEARLSPNLQNWTKLLRFYNSGLSGQLSFEWPDWKSLGLNYSSIYVRNEKNWKNERIIPRYLHCYSFEIHMHLINMKPYPSISKSWHRVFCCVISDHNQSCNILLV